MDPFDYPVQMAALAQTTQLALNLRANSYIGTSSQRQSALSQVVEGSHWTDTNGDKALYIKQVNQWVRVWPDIVYPRVTNFLKAQSGWRSHPSASHYLLRQGDWVYINWVFQRTGGTINSNTRGDIANQTAAILNEEYRPNTWQPLHGGNESGRLWGVTLGSNGHIRLNSVGGTANITKDQTGQVRGWYNLTI